MSGSAWQVSVCIAVRTMLGKLEEKKLLRRDRSKITHCYSPSQSRRKAGFSAVRDLFETFFQDSPADALVMLNDDSAERLSDDDIQRLEQAIADAAREKSRCSTK